MNDFEFLLVLLAVFYAWECLHWIRRPGIAFRSWFGAAWSCKLPTGGLSNRFGGILFSMPLPSLGGFFAVNRAPLIITENKLISHPDPLDLYDETPTRSDARIGFEQIRSIRSKRHHVLVNGKIFFSAGSPSLAESLAVRIKKLKAENPEQRVAMQSQWLKESFDTEVIRESVQTLRDSTRLLGVFCTLLLAHIAVVVPWIGLNFTLANTWPVLVGALLFVNTAIAFQFWRLHSRFYPDASDERFQLTFMMALFPLASIRATETLARPLLENFHPLAVSKVLLTENAFKQAAAWHVRRLGVRLKTSLSTEERDFFERLEKTTREFLRAQKIDTAELLEPPKPGDPSCRSYCPRCGSQFTFESGKCSDCGSVPVERLRASPGNNPVLN